MKKIIIGFLILVFLSASFYVMLPNKVRIDVQKTKTTYQVYEEGWILAATEYVNLFDGSKKMRAKNRSLSQSINEGIIKLTRTANYKDSIVTIDNYYFDSKISDVELTPIDHNTICINCIGKILHFEYRDILYFGETKEISSPFSFGHKMTLEWQDGSYRSKVYQQITNDKIIIRYRPENYLEIYETRLFDPPGFAGINITIVFPVNNTDYLANTLDLNWTINITANWSAYNLDGGANNTAIFFGNIPVNVSLGGLAEGKHNVTIYANDSSGNIGQSDLILFNITHPLKVELNPNLTGLNYNVNWSKVREQLNFSNANTSAGNYSWNFTDLNITTYPSQNWTYVITNNRTVPINVTLKQNQSKTWYEWWCDSDNRTFENSLMAYYTFNANNSKDLTENNNDGTISRAVWNRTNGINITGAFDFNGTNESIRINYAQDFNFTGKGLTVSAWTKTNVVTGTLSIASQYNESDRQMWILYQSNDDYIFIIYHNGSNDNYTISTTASFLSTTNEWHHIVGTWNTSHTAIYADGILKDSDISTNGNKIFDSDLDVFIGETDEGLFDWNGTIDEVSIWNRSLSATEINNIYLAAETGTRIRKNITTTSQNLFELNPQRSIQTDCILNLINISQVYRNWSVTNNRAIWSFIPIFNQTWSGS